MLTRLFVLVLILLFAVNGMPFSAIQLAPRAPAGDESVQVEHPQEDSNELAGEFHDGSLPALVHPLARTAVLAATGSAEPDSLIHDVPLRPPRAS